MGVIPAFSVTQNHITVVTCYESQHDIVLPARTQVAQVPCAERVINPVPPMGQSTPLKPHMFQFGDSSVPKQQKERLITQMLARPEVLSTHSGDMGLAKGVEHTIRLSDTRPFRECSKHLAPADIEDFRKHLQELLAAGIITESQSPNAFLIVVARKKNGSI